MSKNKTEQQGTKSKKKWIIGAVVVLLIIGAAMGGNNGGQTPDPAGSQQTEQQGTEPSSEPTTEPDTEEETDPSSLPEPEANTFEKVTAIAKEAKEAAGDPTDAKRDEAVNFIAEHYPYFYLDNETMETVMYYGYWLEYAYAGNEAARDYEKLGTDTYQSVKYVYTGSESESDEATMTNLRHVKKTLEALGHSVE